MALYRLEAKPVQRSKGQSAVAAAAYRSASVIVDARTGQTHDYQRKLGVFYSEIITPTGCVSVWPRDRPQLWNKAELAEKQHNGQPAREILVALPCELSDEHKIALVSGFVREAFADKGMVADFSLHRADRYGDERNEHAHILLTMRELEGEGFSRTKNRDWNKKEALQEWREQWEEHANRALEDAGSDARVDHRTLEARGIGREPTEHLGSAASAMERDGIHTVKGDRNRETERQNGERGQLATELVEVDAEISEELARLQQEAEPQHPSTVEELIASFTGTEMSEAVKLAMSGEAAEPQHPASMEALRMSYGNAVDLSIDEEYERNNRAWYEDLYIYTENLYYNTVETVQKSVQKYYTNFVDRINAGRTRNQERGNGEPEPDEYERDR